MKEKFLRVANLGLFVGTAMILAAIQTSLWFQVFGYFPSPAFWIPCLVYIALFRSTIEAIVFAYVCGLALSAMTIMPEGVMMVVCLALILSCQVFKNRFYWTTASYLMMVTGIAALGFHIFYLFSSYLIGDTPITSPNISSWLIEALLTPLFAPPLYPLFQWFDRITQRELTTEPPVQLT
jgi:cell shape-determining protein MreD